MALAKVKGAYTRLVQELAAHRAMREKAVASLKRVKAEAPKRAKAARQIVQILQPKLQAWADEGMPPDKAMERNVKLYMRAVEALHDAEYGEHYAARLLQENAESGGSQ